MKIKRKLLKSFLMFTILALFLISNVSYANVTIDYQDTKEELIDNHTEVMRYNVETKEETLEMHNSKKEYNKANNSTSAYIPVYANPFHIVDGDDRDGIFSINRYPYSATCLIISHFNNTRDLVRERSCYWRRYYFNSWTLCL